MSIIRVPVLNIYLGTTACSVGEIVVRELNLSERLDDLDRARIAHMFIDTAPSVKGIAEARTGPVGERALVASADCFHIKTRPDTIRQAMRAAGDHAADMYVRGFTPATRDIGAGNIRNNGLAALCVDENADIPTRLGTYIQKVSAGQAPVAEGQPRERVRVHIVAYLGGGTGSGCLPAMILLAHEALAEAGVSGDVRLFCMVPEAIRQTRGELKSRANANALAGLVELVSIHMQDLLYKHNGPEDSRFSRWVGRRKATLSQERMASQIFLFAQTGAKDLEQIISLVAADILARTQDGYGVGKEEIDRGEDYHALAGGDDVGLPALFSTSCLVDLVFPAARLAAGFAARASHEILPFLTANRENAKERVKKDRLQGVLAGARGLNREGVDSSLYPADLASEVKTRLANAIRANPPRYESAIAEWWEWVAGACQTTGVTRIVEKTAAIRQQEQEMIESGLLSFVDYGLDVGPLAQALLFAESRLQAYQEAYRSTLSLLQELGSPKRDPRAERAIHIASGRPLNKTQQDLLINYLSQAVDQWLWYLLQPYRKELLEHDLLPLAERTYRALEGLFAGNLAGPPPTNLLELRGLLAGNNPHQRSALYLDTWTPAELKVWNPAAEAIYEELIGRLRGPEKRGVSPAALEEATRAIAGNSHLADLTTARLQQILETMLRTDWAQEMNRWTIVDVVNRFVEPYMSNALESHLTWAAQALRPLARFDYSVVGARADVQRDIRLYVGIDERSNSEKLRDMVAARIEGGDVLTFCSSPDLHRLTFMKSWHGISLSMVPDYYQDRPNSPLRTLMDKIEEWEAIQATIATGRDPGPYTVRPPFSCDAAAELSKQFGLPGKLRR